MTQVNTIGNLKILNSRETKHIVEIMSEQYGYEYKKAAHEYAFLMNKDNRIYLVSRNIEIMPYHEFKIDSVGMYLGELYKESLRLSIEGAQMIGPDATKSVIELDDEQMVEWIKGKDIDLEFEDSKHFLIVKNVNKITGKTDFIGTGKYKDGKLLNYVSKSRRLVVVNN
jgi:NOL1/NOP2/fmu family ribosome biogenesis protein